MLIIGTKIKITRWEFGRILRVVDKNRNSVHYLLVYYEYYRVRLMLMSSTIFQ